MIHLTVENVRSFTQKQRIPVAPLTILTGENSSGKTTFLTILATMFDPDGFPFRPGFNRPPYSLGAYDTIATYKGGKFGRAKSFLIGFEDSDPPPGTPQALQATYSETDGQAQLKKLQVSGEEAGLVLEFADRRHSIRPGVAGTIRLNTKQGEEVREFSVRRFAGVGQVVDLAQLILRLTWTSQGGPSSSDIHFFNTIIGVARRLSPGRATSIAPIRTRPERVYSEPTDAFEPHGEHIPFVLDRLLRNGEARETRAVVRALLRYGQQAGLFNGIRVRKLGHKIGDPFQIMVDVGGKMRNLIDVGYGVSQALPVIVQSALTPTREALLIQQPEVHLHPRAQAALGSLFTDFARRGRRRLVVETHSDYIIDRVRQEVASGRIAPDNVRILFFSRRGMETTVYEIKVDSDGNVLGAPESYRTFFLEEQLRLLGRTEQ